MWVPLVHAWEYKVGFSGLDPLMVEETGLERDGVRLATQPPYKVSG